MATRRGTGGWGMTAKRAIDMTDAEIDALSAEDAFAAINELVDEMLPSIKQALEVIDPVGIARKLSLELRNDLLYDPDTIAGVAATVLIRLAQVETP